MTPRIRSAQITPDEFTRLREGARVLEWDGRGEKVLLTRDNRIIKLFYPRHRVSSAHIYPYAYRFLSNAKLLQDKGIKTVQCEQLFHDRKNNRHLVIYPLLPGTTLRDHLQEAPNTDEYLVKLAAFLARVHALGILFRSIHLGNILILEDGDFGLIDVADMSVQRRPLGLFKRARNFRHLLHDQRDCEKLEQFGYDRFLMLYEASANIHGYRHKLLRSLIRHYAPAMIT
jgi:serine/threonine protein kinase